MLFLLINLSSCLESGLEDLPSFKDAEITAMKFEYRWTRNPTTSPLLAVVTMPTVTTINGTTINCTITVPEAGNPSMFTADVRSQVTLSNLIGMPTISTAATINSLEGAPIFGEWGDYTKTWKYRVTAADGKTTKDWTIICTLKK